MEAVGQANFINAFKKTIDLLNYSAKKEFNVLCTIALLFLTDGNMNEPVNMTEQFVMEYVQEQLAKTKEISAPSNSFYIFYFLY